MTRLLLVCLVFVVSGCGQTPQLYGGRSAAEWLADLKADRVETRRNAVHALGYIGADARDAVPALLEVIRKDRDPVTRRAAIHALGEIGAAAGEAVSVLVGATKDPDPDIRGAAADVLLRLDPEAAARAGVPGS